MDWRIYHGRKLSSPHVAQKVNLAHRWKIVFRHTILIGRIIENFSMLIRVEKEFKKYALQKMEVTKLKHGELEILQKLVQEMDFVLIITKIYIFNFTNLFKKALQKNRIDENYVQFIDYKNRKVVDYLLTKMIKYIDVIIPRGGKSLVKKVQNLSKIPVIGHLEGICHTYIDKNANLSMTKKITLNAKLRNTAICGATETILIHQNLLKKFCNPVLSNLEDNGLPPTRADIARTLGFKSPNAAEQHLRAIEKKGFISILAGASRGIILNTEEDLGIPVIGLVAAGGPILAQENIEKRIPQARNILTNKIDYYLRVKGDSMVDVGIYENDLIGVNKENPVKVGSIVIARIGEEVTVKTLESISSKQVVLKAENSEYSNIEINPEKDEIVFEGTCVGLLRDFS